jgi:guanylate kinase
MIFKNIQEIIKYIKKEQPKIIFLTSKSANGKSYLADKLTKFNYITLELDLIVRKLGKKHKVGKSPDYDEAFKLYKNNLPEKIINDFIKQIHLFIKKNKNKNIIIDGAISSPELIRKLFVDIDYKFIYLYPTSIIRYSERLIKRYNKDVKENKKTLPFWEKIINNFKTKKELTIFMKNQAKLMKEQSIKRYNMFVDAGFNILRVNV